MPRLSLAMPRFSQPQLMGAAEVGTNLLGNYLQYKGQKDANAANAQQAKEQMAFQERMANTSWQRGVQDMKSAGLNPALAYEKGGADSGSGSTAHIENAMAGMKGSAKGALEAYTNMAQTKASIAQQTANTRLTDAQTQQLNLESVDRAGMIAAQAQGQRFTNNLNNTTREALVAGRFADTSAKESAANIARNESGYSAQRLYRENNLLGPAQVELLKQQIGLTSSNSRAAAANATLAELAFPQARNNARAAETLWGKSISPFLNDARGAAGLVTPFIRR